ncbi:MAG: ribosome recycling factor [Clostridia bacterium]|nr:ribosome recycling factor [Clostridia bacterium]
MKLDTKPFEEKMQKCITAVEKEFGSVRAGRANPTILDRISVDYYGTPTPINQVAQISTPEARLLVISPWDPKCTKDIEKAILASDIGITPQSDGKTIRLAFPQPTEERRKELTKQVSHMAEEGKVAIRNVRRDAMDKIKAMKKNSEMTEDEQKISEKEVQDLVDEYVKKMDASAAAKSKEIMSF